jgi:hypothetical protein
VRETEKLEGSGQAKKSVSILILMYIFAKTRSFSEFTITFNNPSLTVNPKNSKPKIKI